MHGQQPWQNILFVCQLVHLAGKTLRGIYRKNLPRGWPRRGTQSNPPKLEAHKNLKQIKTVGSQEAKYSKFKISDPALGLLKTLIQDLPQRQEVYLLL
jgi:hypothetical protein